jgi:hypothetical protein
MTLARSAGWVLVAASGILFFSVPVADNDLWGHLYFGRDILDAAALPRLNEYSYTAPTYPWINHEIIAECVFAAVYGLCGPTGLVILKVAMGLATLGLMARTVRVRTDDWIALTLTLVLAASMMSFGYLVRPQLFTFLFTATMWHCLITELRTSSARGLALLPPLFAVWINTHGGVMAGMALLFVVSGLRFATGGRLHAAILLACVAALLVNPYGIELPAFLVEDLSKSRAISEWQSIPVLGMANLQFKIAFALVVLGVFGATRRDVPELVPVILVGLATFRHERHLPLFAIVAAPHVAVTISRLTTVLTRGRNLELSTAAATVVAAAMLTIATVQVRGAFRLWRAVDFGIFVSPAQFPIEAVATIKRQHLRGNLAVPFDWGEYAIWHLYPDCRVSIDGRYTTAYPDDVIRQSWTFVAAEPGWDAPLREASIALVGAAQAARRKLASDPEWAEIHSDSTACVFVRRGTRFIPSAVRAAPIPPSFP